MTAHPYCSLLAGVVLALTATVARADRPALPDPRRIVAIGGAVTEILYTLGFDHRIVAVDTTSVYPERALKEKPNVGYMRQLSSEGILGLAPSGIIAAEGAGPKETLGVLTAAGVPFVTVPDRYTAEGLVERVRIVAHAVGAEAQGACLAAAVEDDLAAVAALRARVAKPARLLFILSFMNDRPMVAGQGTAADGIIALAGATNVITEFSGYKPLNDEAIIAARPDVILAMARPQQTFTAETVFARPAFAATPAAEHQRFIMMEAQYLLGFGPRTARAARDLAGNLYPDIARDELPSERSGRLDACR